MKHDRVARIAGAVVAASAVIVALVMSPAQAATTYTPTGGPNVNFGGGGVSFKDIEVNETFACSRFDLSGSITNPGVSRAYGAPGGSLSAYAPSGCWNSIFGTTWVNPVGVWGLAITGDKVGTSWPARITNVRMNFAGPNCTFTVSGTVSGTYNGSTGVLTPKSGASGLTLDSVVGSLCTTIDLQPGDTVAVGGSWTNTPSSGATALDISNP